MVAIGLSSSRGCASYFLYAAAARLERLGTRCGTLMAQSSLQAATAGLSSKILIRMEVIGFGAAEFVPQRAQALDPGDAGRVGASVAPVQRAQPVEHRHLAILFLVEHDGGLGHRTGLRRAPACSPMAPACAPWQQATPWRPRRRVGTPGLHRPLLTQVVFEQPLDDGLLGLSGL